MRTISKYIYKTEHEHIKVREEIADFLKDNINIFEYDQFLLNMEIWLSMNLFNLCEHQVIGWVKLKYILDSYYII